MNAKILKNYLKLVNRKCYKVLDNGYFIVFDSIYDDRGILKKKPEGVMKHEAQRNFRKFWVSLTPDQKLFINKYNIHKLRRLHYEQ